MKIYIENLVNQKTTALVGRDAGRLFRQAINKKYGELQEIEMGSEKISFIFPKNIITLNKSFFLGAFADRVLAIGSKGFMAKYDFSSSEFIQSKIENYCDYALKSSSIEDIVNG